MDNIELGKKIKVKREELGLTLDDIAVKIGVNKSTIQRYENGMIKSPKLPVIQAISNALNVNPDWLIGKSEIEKCKDPIFDIPNIAPIATQKIPMLKNIICGIPMYHTEEFDSYVEHGSTIPVDFALRCSDDSMINSRIHNGDIVFIHKQSTVINGDIALVLIKTQASLKRVYFNNNSLTLVSGNTKYQPLIYHADELHDVRILGKAVAFQSNL